MTQLQLNTSNVYRWHMIVSAAMDSWICYLIIHTCFGVGTRGGLGSRFGPAKALSLSVVEGWLEPSITLPPILRDFQPLCRAILEVVPGRNETRVHMNQRTTTANTINYWIRSNPPKPPRSQAWSCVCDEWSRSGVSNNLHDEVAIQLTSNLLCSANKPVVCCLLFVS